MGRSYTLGKRAEKQEGTRQRIVEALVDLHGTVGPARTTISMLADHAGVQRHTIYAHFPDERSLFMACSGLVLERAPPPEAEPWRAIRDPRDRLRTGLRAVYGWFEPNAPLFACVQRDGEHHELTREVEELRFGPPVMLIHEVLGEGLTAEQRALLALALSFQTWRTLVRDEGLASESAAGIMVRAILGPEAA